MYVQTQPYFVRKQWKEVYQLDLSHTHRHLEWFVMKKEIKIWKQSPY